MKVSRLISFSVLVTTLFNFSLYAKQPKKSFGDFSIFKDVDLKKAGPHQRRELHKKLTELVVNFEKNESYPKYQKSLFSFNRFLESIIDGTMDACYAADGDTCLFGGWISVRQGSCSVPWGSAARTLHEQEDLTQYLDNGKCGHPDLFRCNPVIFGPGVVEGMDTSAITAPGFNANINGAGSNADASRGICVSLGGTYNGLSAKCQAVSAALDTVRSEPWRNSQFFEDRADDFQKIMALMGERCGEDAPAGDGMCEALRNAASAVVAAGLAGDITSERLGEMGLDCVALSREGSTSCSPEGQGVLLSQLNTALSEAIQTAENCDANFAITTNGRISPTSDRRFCRVRVANDALTYSLTEGNPTDVATTQSYQIVYTVEGRQVAFPIEVSGGLSPDQNGLRDRILGMSEFREACQATHGDKCAPPHESLTPLREALTDIQNSPACRFDRISVYNQQDFEGVDGEVTGLPINDCTVGIGGSLQVNGISGDDEQVQVTLYNRSGLPQTVSLNLTASLTKEQIVSQLTTGDNQAAYDQACEAARAGVCGPIPQNEIGRAIQSDLQGLASMTQEDGTSCGFDYVNLIPNIPMPEDEPEISGPTDIPEFAANCGAVLDNRTLRILSEGEFPQSFKLVIRKGGQLSERVVTINGVDETGRSELRNSPLARDLCYGARVATPAEELEVAQRIQEDEMVQLAQMLESYGLNLTVAALPEERRGEMMAQLNAFSEAGITPANNYTFSLSDGNIVVTTGVSPTNDHLPGISTVIPLSGDPRQNVARIRQNVYTNSLSSKLNASFGVLSDFFNGDGRFRNESDAPSLYESLPASVVSVGSPTPASDGSITVELNFNASGFNRFFTGMGNLLLDDELPRLINSGGPLAESLRGQGCVITSATSGVVLRNGRVTLRCSP